MAVPDAAVPVTEATPVPLAVEPVAVADVADDARQKSMTQQQQYKFADHLVQQWQNRWSGRRPLGHISIDVIAIALISGGDNCSKSLGVLPRLIS